MLYHCRKAGKKQDDAAKDKAAVRVQKQEEKRLKQTQLNGMVTAHFESEKQQTTQPRTAQQQLHAKGAGPSRGMQPMHPLLK